MCAFRRGGARKRRDANEPEIIDALRRSGRQVWQISGAGLPDLLVYGAGKFTALEVKTAKGGLTALQAQQANPWPVVRSAEDALREVQR